MWEWNLFSTYSLCFERFFIKKNNLLIFSFIFFSTKWTKFAHIYTSTNIIIIITSLNSYSSRTQIPKLAMIDSSPVVTSHPTGSIITTIMMIILMRSNHTNRQLTLNKRSTNPLTVMSHKRPFQDTISCFFHSISHTLYDTIGGYITIQMRFFIFYQSF